MKLDIIFSGTKVSWKFGKITAVVRGMPKKILWLAIIFLVVMGFCMCASFAQESVPTNTTTNPSNSLVANHSDMSDIQKRLNELEFKQDLILKTFEKNMEHIHSLITLFSVFFVVIGVIFGIITAWTSIRQAHREERLLKIHSEYADADHTGATQVSNVLKVVHETLESRLLSERKVEKELKELMDFMKKQQASIQYERKEIGKHARELAETPRHEIKKKTTAIREFARDFDSFKRRHPGKLEVNARCLYVRGLAAFLDNDLPKLKKYFEKTTAFTEPLDGENTISCQKRLANAYYYLGVNYSNCGDYEKAIESMEEAKKLDLSKTDFLTRLVMAEAYLMSGGYDKDINKLLEEVEKGVQELKDAQGGVLRPHQKRMLSRAFLMRANLSIIRGKDLKKVKEYSEYAYEVDPSYYYAKYTLGQIKNKLEDIDEARELFDKAYSIIQNSGDIHTTTEILSKILLLMVSAICCRNGLKEDVESMNSHLDKARALLTDLQGQLTVFSPISKQNANKKTIDSHIDQIRDGIVLLD